MAKKSSFIIDKITNSIEDSKSKMSFETEVLLVSKNELKSILKKNGWNFNWRKEFLSSNRILFKLVILNEHKIQGLVSIQLMDNFIEMHLIEVAPDNKGKSKKYMGVAANLVAYVCKTSFDLGFDGIIAFNAKTNLVEQYKLSLGAVSLLTKERMVIPSTSAKKLVSSYYKDYRFDR